MEWCMSTEKYGEKSLHIIILTVCTHTNDHLSESIFSLSSQLKTALAAS